MAGTCRQRRLRSLEFAHVHELLEPVNKGSALADWPSWFKRAYERGVVGLGPGLLKITVRYCRANYNTGPDIRERVAGPDDVIIHDDGHLIALSQTEFDQAYEVL